MKQHFLLFAISVPLSLARPRILEHFCNDKFETQISPQNCVLRAGSNAPSELTISDSSVSKYTKRSDIVRRQQAIAKACAKIWEVFSGLQSFISGHSFDVDKFYFMSDCLKDDMTEMSNLVDAILPPDPMISRELKFAQEMFTDMFTYARLLREENNNGPFADQVLRDISELKVMLYTLYDIHGQPNTYVDGYRKKLSFFRLRGEILDLARQEVAKTHLTASLLLGFDLKKVWDSINFLNICAADGFESEEIIGDDLELDLEDLIRSDVPPHFNAPQGHAINY